MTDNRMNQEKFLAEFERSYVNLNPDIEWIKKGLIFLTLYGSHAHGLNTPESDLDFRGVVIPPREYHLGFNKSFNEFIRNDPDTTLFNIRKFFKLTSECNPNCIEVLFVEPEDILISTKAGQVLLEHREKFLSKNVKERYCGYAKAQAHRIRQHRKWLLSKIEVPPTRAEMNLPEKPPIDKAQFDVIKALINKKLEEWNPHFEPFSESQKIYLRGKIADILTEMTMTRDETWVAAARTIGLSENLITLIKREKEWENKQEDWANYQNWKKTRNPKRAAMEAKFGYDLKHGTALIRLLRMGKEILDTGKVLVRRKEDREELMAIKQGAWSYDQLTEYADKMEAEVRESYKHSRLPNQPDIPFLDNLCISLIEQGI